MSTSPQRHPEVVWSPGILEADIRAQAGAYTRLIVEAPRLWDGGLDRVLAPSLRRIVLTGMGSSFFAALATRDLLAAAGHDAVARLASELLHYGPALGPGDLLVAVTQSGESAEVVRVLDRAVSSGASAIAVTRGEASTAASLAGAVMPLDVPPDHGVAIKTFGASLLALSYLSARIRGDTGAWRGSAEQAVLAVGRIDDGPSRRLGAGLGHDMTAMVALARGPLRPAAQEAALLANEVAKVPAWAEESGQFRHGIIELAGPNVAVALLAEEGPGADLQVGLAAELERTGAAMIATSPPRLAARLSDVGAHVIPLPEVDPMLAALVHVVCFQWVSLGWAEARGVDPGRFLHAQDVVRSEAGG